MAEWLEQLNTGLQGFTRLTASQVFDLARQTADGLTAGQMVLAEGEIDEENGLLLEFRSRFPRIHGNHALGGPVIFVAEDIWENRTPPGGFVGIDVSLVEQLVRSEQVRLLFVTHNPKEGLGLQSLREVS